jgi:photosystem II stability/assembly factor-like uncharacterized protein
LTIYAGGLGVAKTSDGGESWQPVNEGLAGIVPSFLAVNPINPAIVYGVSAGIYGTQTGGKAWQLLPGEGGPIVVDPDNPQHVVIGTAIADDGWHFDRSFTLPRPPERDDPAYQLVPNSMAARSGMWLMGVGYLDTRLPYFNYEGGGGIYLSADGEDWTWVGPLLDCPPTGLAFDPVDDDTMYAITSGMRGGASCDGAFLRSTDSGQTWQETKTGLGNVIVVEPVSPYRIFDGCSVSEDQGVTWNDLVCPGNVWANSLLFLGDSPRVLYAGTGVGLFRSTDGSQTWQRASGALGQLEIWSLAGTTIDDRQILYVASVGGSVDAGETQVSDMVNNSTLVNPGVYRYTTFTQYIYLPIVLTMNAP